MLKYGEDVGVIVIDGKKYKLQQLHWHSPSEHTIDGVQYPVEMHLVHLRETGDISVVAVLYKYGHADPFLSQLAEKVTTLTRAVKNGSPHANVSAGFVSTRALTQHTTSIIATSVPSQLHLVPKALLGTYSARLATLSGHWP
ncbi:alpha carbonic anhydrase 1, chloroplastic-like [Wolffia australiana]